MSGFAATFEPAPAAVHAPIDWTRPWLASVQDAAQRVRDGADWRLALTACAADDGLRNHAGLPITFVPQAALPAGTAYEAFIGATGCVPTRDNLHDFFNALVWLSFPLLKRRLNALQAAQIALAGVGRERGAARDAATIFDENAALLVVRDGRAGRALVAALRSHRWQRAFIGQRADFGSAAEVWLFGHALMEKLVHPYRAITAHAWVLLAPADFFTLAHAGRRAWIDAEMAQQLERQGLSSAGCTPLPVLGVPGWWPGQDAAFYADASVFRPQRAARNPA